MLSISQSSLDKLNQATTLSMLPGCWLEYNMNDLIDGVSITAPDGVMTVTKTAPDGSTYKPFATLFPITSIIDPRRPKTAGIKYLINSDPSTSTTLASGISTNYSASKQYGTRLYFAGTKSPYKYWVTPQASGTSLSNCILTVSYPSSKTAITNKITIKFETSHSKPINWSLKLTPISGAEVTVGSNISVPDNGVVNFYYNGTAWSTTEPSTPSAGINLSGLKLQIDSLSVSGGYVGVIEISANYVMDVTDRLVTFSTNKNASDAPNGLLPVGDVTSNLLSLSLNGYDGKYLSYDKTVPFDGSKVNLYKNVKAKPYFILEGEKVLQGLYYVDSFTVSEWGDIQITALDGAKNLQTIFPPDIVMQNTSSTAIIRRLLDSVGFTNYNYNYADTDTSSITPYYWYTDSSKTVWEHLQELCKDTQTIAVFDENDILQFYPRDYVFSNRNSSFKFRYSNLGNNVANIASMDIENVPTVKAARINYTPQINSSQNSSGAGNADLPWQADTATIIGAAALVKTLEVSAPAETDAPLGVIYLEPVAVNGVAEVLYSHTGYLLIDHEIIEYDAIKYTYQVLGTTSTNSVWITSDADKEKYRGFAEPTTLRPTGMYRIKTRNAFNALAAPEKHVVDTAAIKAEWSGFVWDSKAGTVTSNEEIFKVDSYTSSKLQIPISKSMMTIIAPDATLTTTTDSAGNSITVPTLNNNYSVATTTAKYLSSTNNFIIGTSMYFPLIKTQSGQATGEQLSSAGLLFGLSSDNKNGYMIKINTTQNANKDTKYRDIAVYKITNGIPKLMNDTQESSGSLVRGINGGSLYRLDVKGNITTSGGKTYLTLKVYWDNSKFVVVDDNPYSLTEKVGLVSAEGISAFDYIYSSSISSGDFISDVPYDISNGFLGKNSQLVKNFSDFVFAKGDKVDQPSWLKEFGPVARELKRITSRFSQAPVFPRYVALKNTDVTLLGSALDSFSMDIFVINNTGVFTELADGQFKSLGVVGDSVVPLDPLQYLDPSLSDIDKRDQVGFDSTWIQKESEATALGKWITNQWSKQQQVLTITTFSNPVLQIGDVVEVSYPRLNIYSTEDTSVPSGYSPRKYVIIGVENSSDLSTHTTVTCRSIYTG